MPDCAWPSTSPSRRCSRSIRDSSKPSSVAATASSRARAGLASGISLTSRHRPGALPRPTRPRSWCSWETPNRSASMITMTVALGTLTPTSIDRRRHQHVHLAGGEAAHHVVLGVRRHPAVQHLDPQPGQRPAAELLGDVQHRQRRAASRRRPRPAPPPLAGRSSSSPIRGQTTYAWWPAPTSSRTRSQARAEEVRLVLGRHDVGGDRRAAGRAAGRGPRSPGRRRRSSRPCAGSGWRSSPAGAAGCFALGRAARRAARPRSGAARRPRPGPGRGTAPCPRSARGCR